MIIDRPREGDLPGLRSIWREAFGDGDAFLDGFYATGFSFDRSRLVRMDGRPVSVLYWFDCTWQEQKIAYIYAVATDKAYRGRRLAGKLLEDTHLHLQTLGYSGALLVPGSQSLFDFYAPFGYRPCCPMESRTLSADGKIASVSAVSAEQYGNLRQKLLPANAVIQQGAALSYLATYAGFWAADGCLLAATQTHTDLTVHEYLGDPEKLPGLLGALGAGTGAVRMPGGSKMTAMYCSFRGDSELPFYFGLTLG